MCGVCIWYTYVVWCTGICSSGGTRRKLNRAELDIVFAPTYRRNHTGRRKCNDFFVVSCKETGLLGACILTSSLRGIYATRHHTHITLCIYRKIAQDNLSFWSHVGAILRWACHIYVMLRNRINTKCGDWVALVPQIQRYMVCVHLSGCVSHTGCCIYEWWRGVDVCNIRQFRKTYSMDHNLRRTYI